MLCNDQKWISNLIASDREKWPANKRYALWVRLLGAELNLITSFRVIFFSIAHSKEEKEENVEKKQHATRDVVRLFCDFCFDNPNAMTVYFWMKTKRMREKKKKNWIYSKRANIQLVNGEWWMMNKWMRLLNCSLCGTMKCMGNLNFRFRNDSNMHILLK